MKALGLSPAEKEILPASLNSVSTACHLGRLGMLELGGGGCPATASLYKEPTLPSTFKISVNLTRAQRMLAGWLVLIV